MSQLAKAKRTILRRIRIREISGVDFPAQEPALVALVKMRDKDDPEPASPDDPAPEGADSATPHEENDAMPTPDEIKTAEELAALKSRVAQLTSEGEARTKAHTEELAKARAWGALSDAEKAHAEHLDTAGRDTFVAKSTTGRAEEIKESIAYTTEDGVVYYKRDDKRLIKMAQDRDTERKAAVADRDAREGLQLAKRAQELIPNLTGTEEAQVALMKAVAAMPDAVRPEVERILKSASTAQADSFAKVGSRNATPEQLTAEQKFDKGVQDYAKEKSVSVAVATREFAKSDTGRALYKAAYETVPGTGGN